jgi:hypothetical protein
MSDAAPINPYEPPQGPIADDRVEAEVYLGPWRDRGLLVVDIDEKDSMPWRCVVSGVEIEPGQRARFSIYPARLNSPIEFLHRYWPISSAKRPRWRPIHVIGWGMIVASVVGFVIGLFSVYAWFLCIVTAFLGGLILRWSSPRWLKIVRVAGRQVWVSGAHPNFLAVLPPWQETARASDAPHTEFHGPWRDGPFIVVDCSREDVGISRCVFTGVDVDAREQTLIPVTRTHGLLPDGVYNLRWPWARRARPTWSIMDVAIWSLVVAGAMAMFLKGAEIIPSLTGVESLYFLIPAVCLFALRRTRALVLQHRDGNFIWVAGVHPRCLEDLPEVRANP